MARVGTTSPTLAPPCGTAGHTRTAWEPALRMPAVPDGALASATAMPTLPGTTRGGDPWDITDAAGTRITGGAHGAVLPWPMRTGCGATQRTRARARPGRTLTPATTVLRRAVPIRMPKPAGLP